MRFVLRRLFAPQGIGQPDIDVVGEPMLTSKEPPNRELVVSSGVPSTYIRQHWQAAVFVVVEVADPATHLRLASPTELLALPQPLSPNAVVPCQGQFA